MYILHTYLAQNKLVFFKLINVNFLRYLFFYWRCAPFSLSCNNCYLCLFQVPKDYMAVHHDIVDLAVTGHIIHGNGMKSGDFKTFLAQFPEWSYPVGWTASYKAFVF